MSFAICYYPHNDLGNLAHYHLEVINQKLAREEDEGLSLDCMSFLIALAFSVEALINFVGSNKIKNWKERDKYATKIKTIFTEIGLVYNEASEPYITLGILKVIRDQMAHGKPTEFYASVSSKKELRGAMASPWDKHLDPKFCIHAYEQVMEFKKLIFELAEIKISASLTSGIGGW